MPKYKAKNINQLKNLADKNNIDISPYDENELLNGFKIEGEHSDIIKEPIDQLKIAIVHLKELPDYYTRLKKIEEFVNKNIIRKK